MHDITGDSYLAGHWRRELGRSLLWRVENVATSSRPHGPARVQPYRAPTWSWASIDGFVRWEMIDATQNGYQAECMEILDARVDVPGQNLFGEVSYGRITMKVTAIEATRDEGKDVEWTVGTNASYYDDGWISQESPLRFLGPGGALVGAWIYDDIALVRVSAAVSQRLHSSARLLTASRSPKDLCEAKTITL
jgi:hypothetical protein